MMYAVTLQTSSDTKDGWHGGEQVPTFFLDEHLQGILNENGAREVAHRIAQILMKADRVYIGIAEV
jgi:hypothetical protein